LTLLGQTILLSTLFSNTLSLYSSLNVTDQTSHSYKTTCKYIVLSILIFDFNELVYSKIFEIFHTFKVNISYLYIVNPSCVLISTHDHVPSLMSFYY
jgi:hypothetical protein